VRGNGDPPSGDVEVDEAYDGLGATYTLFHVAYGRHSIDAHDMELDATVHYGTRAVAVRGWRSNTVSSRKNEPASKLATKRCGPLEDIGDLVAPFLP